MRQEINLFQEKVARQTIVFSTLHFIKAMIGFFVFLVFLTVIVFFQHQSVKGELEALNEKKHALQQSIESVRGKLPSEEKKQAILKNIEHLKAIKAQNEQMFNTLNDLQEVEHMKFSDYLNAFSTKMDENTSLSAFGLMDGGKKIHIKGQALRPENVPALVQSLGEHTIFKNKKFEIFRLEQANQAKYLEYTLESYDEKTAS